MGLLASIREGLSVSALMDYAVNTRTILIEDYFEKSESSLGKMWQSNSKRYYVAINGLKGNTSILKYPTIEDFLLLVKSSNIEDPMVKLAWDVLNDLHVQTDCEISDIKPISRELYQYLFMQGKSVESYVDSTLVGRFCGFVSGGSRKTLN